MKTNISNFFVEVTDSMLYFEVVADLGIFLEGFLEKCKHRKINKNRYRPI